MIKTGLEDIRQTAVCRDTDDPSLHVPGIFYALNTDFLNGVAKTKEYKEQERKKMFALFENLTNWLWGLPLLITILATGVYLTVRSGFFQFRHFGYIVKNMFSKERLPGRRR